MNSKMEFSGAIIISFMQKMIVDIRSTCREYFDLLYRKTEENRMSQTMTFDEKLATSNKALDLFDAGDKAGYDRLMRTVPMPPYLAKVMKDKMGVDFLINGGWNLSEAEAEFGSDWLSK
jgi:hypothetical protein